MGQQLGMAFQLADDLDDMEQDAKSCCGRANINYALVYGERDARKEGVSQLDAFDASVVELGLALGSDGRPSALAEISAWLRGGRLAAADQTPVDQEAP